MPNAEHIQASVLALHGFTGCGKDFDCMRHAFPDVYFDTPDLHAADIPEDFPGLLTLLEDRFEQLSKTQPRILLGYSMGGRIALHLALRLARNGRFRKGDRLILISASPGLKSEEERKSRREHDAALARKILAAPDAAAFYAFWRTVPIIASQANIPEPWNNRILENRAAADKTHWARSLETLGTGALPPLWDELGEINVETLLVCGENDAKFTQIAETMHAALPHSRLVKIPGCGHTPQLEDPDAFKAKLHGKLQA